MNTDEIVKTLQAQFDKMRGAYEVMSALAEVRKEEIESLQAQLADKTTLIEATIAGQETLQKALNRRAQPENEPLTLDELRLMDGEPVYVVTLDNPLENQPYWAIAGINSNDSRHQNGVSLYNRVQGDWGAFDLYGDTWLAYRRKLERSEG